jgi:hypothetical protein
VHWLDPVRAALDRLATPPEVFFRDDDAGWDDARLHALLDRFAHHGLPLDLAVIPAALDHELAHALRRRAATQPLGLHQHGYAHRNHEPDGRKYEFGPDRPAQQQHRDIAAGAAHLRELLGDLIQPIFTPPWNRCTRDTGHALVDLGFTVLSREWRAAPLGIESLEELPIRIDWVKRDAPEQLATALADRRPIGVMFHHAVMDGADLARADELLALLADRARADTILGYAGAAIRSRPARSRSSRPCSPARTGWP